MRLATVALVVRDYDEALDFYTRALGFDCVEDRAMPGGKRWLVVAPPGGRGAALARRVTSGQPAFAIDGAYHLFRFFWLLVIAQHHTRAFC